MPVKLSSYYPISEIFPRIKSDLDKIDDFEDAKISRSDVEFTDSGRVKT